MQSGQEHLYPPKPNGKKLHAAQMGGNIPGEVNGMLQNAMLMEVRHSLLEVILLALAHMAVWIWLVMLGSGALTGMVKTTIRAPRLETRLDHQMAVIVSGGVAVGTASATSTGAPPAPSASAASSRATVTTTTGSVYPVSLALSPFTLYKMAVAG